MQRLLSWANELGGAQALTVALCHARMTALCKEAAKRRAAVQPCRALNQTLNHITQSVH